MLPSRRSARSRLDVGAVARLEKSFLHPVIGDPVLNACGLHLMRIKASDLSARLRHRTVPHGDREAHQALRALRLDGVAVLPEFLPATEFRALRDEVDARLLSLAGEVPRPTHPDAGFGPKRPFAGGFDRFDGGSLNRFVEIEASRTPRAHAWIRTERLLRLCEATTSLRPAPPKFWIQQLVQGGPSDPFDIQQELHRDTFHAAYKLWYFVAEVSQEQGPFEYVPGSQRMTPRRLRWEYMQSTRARSLDAESANGSFRIDERALSALDLPAVRAYAVAANTLLIADVRGFHRRGRAKPGAVRTAIHANLRPHPFRG